jgi:hypothetical protein
MLLSASFLLFRRSCILPFGGQSKPLSTRGFLFLAPRSLYIHVPT